MKNSTPIGIRNPLPSFVHMLLLACSFLSGWSVVMGAETAVQGALEGRKIWDKAPHNAFTDLARWKESWWCVFRESEGHVGGDGKIRVLTSKDGGEWRSAALVEEEGIDLRDPKICVTPDDRLMLVAGGSVYKGGTALLSRQPRVAFSRDGLDWGGVHRVLDENDWLWRVTWHEGLAYGMSYRTSAPEGTAADTGEWTLTLCRSRDGLAWERLGEMSIPGRPNETTLRFRADGECLALVRRESADREGWFGSARPPYRDWQWQPIGRGIGGPNFLVLADGRLLASGRDYRKDGPKTALDFLVSGKWPASVTLTSGSDTSYPGMVEYEGTVWISYYSTHEGKSAIYFAKFPIGPDPDQARPAKDEADLGRWLRSMVWYHHYTEEEMCAVLGMNREQLSLAMTRHDLHGNIPVRQVGDPLLVLPYPGGRHPRIGFLEGAINPQRETKLSIFPPWADGGYVCLDVPEAVFSNLGLLYLAHTHIPTIWEKQGLKLPRQEWQPAESGAFTAQRELPNGISFKVIATPTPDHVALLMKLTNGTNAPLSELRVQVCAMLKAAAGFESQTNDNKVFDGPFAACRDRTGRRWIIHAWKPLHRTWANPPCPCLHSDPIFPDCPAGATREVHGWFSFFEGDDVRREFQRIAAVWNLPE